MPSGWSSTLRNCSSVRPNPYWDAGQCSEFLAAYNPASFVQVVRMANTIPFIAIQSSRPHAHT